MIWHFPERQYDPVNKVYKVSKSEEGKVREFAAKFRFQFVDSATQERQWGNSPAARPGYGRTAVHKEKDVSFSTVWSRLLAG